VRFDGTSRCCNRAIFFSRSPGSISRRTALGDSLFSYG
jgi:hypothetical protein